MARPLRVALLVESSHGFGRAVLQGIAQYARAYGQWTFFHEERAFDDPVPAALAAWRPDGVIARIARPAAAQALRRLRCPVVDLYEEHPPGEWPRVVVDHRAVVRLAIDHLRECGLQNFAYTGFPRVRFSLQRARLFAEGVRLWRFEAHLHLPPSAGCPAGLAAAEACAARHHAALAAWLRRLPKPVGLLASNDMRAQQVLAVCREHGLAVPESVAVLGVDNDEVRCDLASPSLSSVDPNAHRIGYEAAQLLHRALRGKLRGAPTVVVEPIGVVRRQSTEVLACSDPELGEVLRALRHAACQGQPTEQLVRASGFSRATLDRWFLRGLGRTLSAEVARLRVQRVRELLATTELPLKQVARLAGFRHVETMYRVFGRATGQTPADYRRTTSCRRSPLAPQSAPHSPLYGDR